MEAVGILRVLWRRRILVGLGALLAFGLGLLMMYRISLFPPTLQSRTTASGYALERDLVDTAPSAITEVREQSAASSVSSAALLGGLLASDEARATMAGEVGVQPSEIGVIGPGTETPVVTTALAEQAIQVAKPHEPYLVTVSEDPGLPILTILATGPDPQTAGKLAKGASVALATLARRSTAVRGEVRIDQLGRAEIGTRESGTGKLKAALIAFVAFVAWCLAIVMLDGFNWRRHRSSAWTGGQARA